MTALRILGLILAMVLVGCGGKSSQPRTLTIFQRGAHPVVASWYYSLRPHAYDCKDNAFGCAECPVGKSDRVIALSHGEYRDVPDSINVYFACDDINRLIPEPSRWVDSDVFICQREPADGFVVLDGHKYSCSTDVPHAQEIPIGSLRPGETKSFTLDGNLKGKP